MTFRSAGAAAWPRLTASLIVVGAASWCAPSDLIGDDELARRTFANAEQLMREQKHEQALRDYEQVATAWPDSPVADDALYRMGAWYYPAEEVEALGRTSRRDLEKARDLLSRIPSRYPREDHAPRALIKLGLIAMDPANPARSLDEAYASFTGVVNIYPSSDVVDRALLGAGIADLMAGRAGKSIEPFERVVEDFPASPVVEDALFWMGEALAVRGDHVRALEELQRVRNRFPEGRLGGRAIDRMTLLYKTRIEPGLGRSIFEHDSAYRPALDEDAARGGVAIAVGTDSVLHVLYPRTGALARLTHGGKPQRGNEPQEGAVAIDVDALGRRMIAYGTSFRAGAHVVSPRRIDRGELRPIDSIEACTGLPDGSVAFLDARRNEILRYVDDPTQVQTRYRDPEGRVRLQGLAAAPDGTLFTIDRRERRVLAIDAQGRAREVVPAGSAGVRREPVALDVDPLGTLYVLDGRARSILVMMPDGRVLQEIPSASDTPADFDYASEIAAGPRGEIYVYDDKRRTILRFW